MSAAEVIFLLNPSIGYLVIQFVDTEDEALTEWLNSCPFILLWYLVLLFWPIVVTAALIARRHE